MDAFVKQDVIPDGNQDSLEITKCATKKLGTAH